MFPTAQTTNTQQHAQLQLPSIRTRSQQTHLLSTVDLSASPMKEAIRSHNRDRRHLAPNTSGPLEPVENVQAHATRVITHAETNEKTCTPPPRPKRALSPSFTNDGRTDKRIRMDFIELSKSPIQMLQTPNKSFRNSFPEVFGDRDAQQRTPRALPPTEPIPDEQKHSHTSSFEQYISGNTSPGQRGEAARISIQTISTPTCSRAFTLVGKSPLTPLPETFHGSSPLRPPTFPQGTVDGRPITFPPVSPSKCIETGKLALSPSKSRIPVSIGTASRPLLPSSKLSGFESAAATSGSSHSTSARPLKPKHPKINRKPKADVRSRPPMTRLAAKRGIKRSSLSGVGLRTGGPPSTKARMALSLSKDSGSPSKLMTGIISGTNKNNSIKTSSATSVENAAASKTPSIPPSTSPKSLTKPTPLSALSNALQKLMVTRPARPAQRPRPNTSLGFVESNHLPVQPDVPEHHEAKVVIDLQTPRKDQPADVGIQPSQIPASHSPLRETTNGSAKGGLPFRRPGFTSSGGSALATGMIFASKQTSLSTVPASPVRSAVQDGSSSPRPKPVGSPDANRKGKSKEDAIHVEYTVPLADDSRIARPVLPGLLSPSRRASQASLSLTQSLTLPQAATERGKFGRSVSSSRAVSYNSRTPVKTRARTKPAPLAPAQLADHKNNGPMGGKRSNARMPGSLDVLKDCVIFADVRTEEGEDAGALFIDMLRGLGARILAKPGKSCTHLVYKDGSPMTLTKYRLLPEPRPLLISIGWVVECAEKREHVDETRFLVDIDEIGIAGSAQRRRSMQPKQMRTLTLGQLESGQSADVSVRADSSFTSEEPSTSTSKPFLTGLSLPAGSPSKLPPLERARQRSLQLSRM